MATTMHSKAAFLTGCLPFRPVPCTSTFLRPKRHLGTLLAPHHERVRHTTAARTQHRPQALMTSSNAAAGSPSKGSKNPTGMRPKQSLGQNFLRDKNIIMRIVNTFEQLHATHAPGTHVVEVGPGLGALTDELLPLFPSLHAIEIDQRAVQQLQERHPNLSVDHEDVLKTDWQTLSSRLNAPISVIGNLPYNIVSQILFSLLEAPNDSVKVAMVMMQKEVAERIVSRTRCKSYGILSVVTQLYAKPTILFSVPNTAFYPKPDVVSAMVQFEFTPHELFDIQNRTLTAGLKRVVKAAFNQRRKVLRNSLKTLCEVQDVALPDQWQAKRAEELTPIEFIQLTEFMYAKQLSDRSEDNDGDSGRSVWR